MIYQRLQLGPSHGGATLRRGALTTRSDLGGHAPKSGRTVPNSSSRTLCRLPRPARRSRRYGGSCQTVHVHGPDIETRRSERKRGRDHDCPSRAPRTAAIVRIIARAQRRWHNTRQEDCEQRPQGVPAVRRRPPRSRGVRAVGVVGGAHMAGLNVSPGHYQTATALCVGGTASNDSICLPPHD